MTGCRNVVVLRPRGGGGRSCPACWRSAGSWRLGRRRGEVAAVTVSVFAVMIMVLSSILTSADVVGAVGSSGARFDSSPVPGTSNSSETFQIPGSMFPAPSFLPASVVANETYAHLAYASDGYQSFFAMGFVASGGGSTALEFQIGAYSASLAYSLAGHAACTSNCPWNLPINWSAPVVVARFGTQTAQGAALAVSGAWAAAAVTFSGETYVYFSPDLGASGSWTPVTASQAISGGSPNITLQPCQGILVTTMNSSAVVATTFAISCSIGLGSGTGGTGGQAVLPPPTGLEPSGPIDVQGSSIVIESRATADFPAADSAWPVWTTGAFGFSPTLGVLCSLVGDSFITFYHTTQIGGTFSASLVAPFSSSYGSPIFTTIGDTRLQTPGGAAGLVSVTSIGSTVFGIYTTRAENRTVVYAVTSDDYGTSWGQPYLASSVVGSVNAPDVAPSPAGYIYATWTDNGNGPWEVDEQEFAASGEPLGNVTILPQSQGYEHSGAQVPSVAVDAFQRPLYIWTALNSTGWSQLEGTGGFLSPLNSMEYLSQAIGATSPADYAYGTPASRLTAYETSLQANLSSAETEEGSYSVCSAAKEVVQYVYPYVTRTPTIPESLGPGGGSCGTLPVLFALIANEAGSTVANFSLPVETEWVLEALGYGTYKSPNWAPALPIGQTGAPVPLDSSDTVFDGAGDMLNVMATTVNPKSLLWNLTSTFNSYNVVKPDGPASGDCSPDPGSASFYMFDNTSSVSNYSTEVRINSMAPKIYSTTEPLTQVFATNLTPQTSGSWQVELTGNYSEVSVKSTWCLIGNPLAPVPYEITATNTSVPVQRGWPTSASLTTTGRYSTYFGYDPGTPLVNVTTSGSYDQLQVAWSNSMLGNATVNLTDFSNNGAHLPPASSTSGYRLAENWTFASVPVGHRVVVYDNATSYPGTTAGSWTPTYNTGQTTTNVAADSASAACSLSTSPSPVTIHWSRTGAVTNVTGTSVVLTWYSSTLGSGWVHYIESGGSWESSVAEEFSTGSGNYTYQASLHGLTPWEVYTADLGVTEMAPGSSCEEFSGSGQLHFDTAAKFKLSEADLPYDSVTQEGGGAVLSWALPPAFMVNATYSSGELTFFAVGNSSSSVQIPLASLPAPTPGQGCFYCYELNVSGLVPNTVYNASMDLNFTSIDGSSYPFTFWYEKDTSGDGLSDWEKVRGWEVSYQDLGGTTQDEWVTADPAVFATNGLVGDFVEKEYGLNPNTVNSADSGMLDTWNLTFNLAPGGGALPSGSDFAVWYENSTYKPFASSVQYSPGLFESGNPIQKNITNISASGGITSGDGAPWAARALWSYSALETFVALPGVENAGELRAIEGFWKGLPTLTVEGKLSWGANPLATSTPDDGIADGQRVDPLYDVGLEFHSVDANQSSLGTGTGYAVWMGESYQSDSGAGREVSNYSSQGLVGNATAPKVSNYVTTLPVTQTQRTQTVSLEVVADESGGLKAVPINGSQTEVNVSYDLVKGAPVTVRVSGSGSGGRSTLFGVFQEVPMGTKAPTWLWLPTDNSTVNGLPLGLQRYTGEQSFDLVVVNASASVTSDPIPLPWGGTASGVALSAGMNDFLVPREQFLDSPLGQAIFLGKNTSYNASAGAPPLVGSAEQGYITGFDGANLMVDLGAYWQNRSIASGPGNITGPHEGGTPAGSALEIQVMAASSATGDNTGGLPSNPALYSTVGDPSALQSIVTLNITSTPTLDLLLAALIDNTTGGANAVNGTLESVTYQVGFLGLNAAVANAISNATEPNDGLYGPPASHFPPPPPPSGWGAFWNAVTSFVTNPLGTVLALVSVVWNAATAAFTYLNHLAHEAVAIGAEVVARTAAAIVHVGQIIANALGEFLQYLIQIATTFLETVTRPIVDAFTTYASPVNSSFARAEDAVSANGTLPPTDANAVWTALSGPLFLTALGLGAVIATVLTVLSTIDLGPSFVADLLIGLLVGTLAGLAIQALMSAVTSSFSSFTANSVYAVESFFNGTVGSQRPALAGSSPDTGGSGSNQPAWTTVALLVASLAEFKIAFPIDLYELVQTSNGPAGVFAFNALAFALNLAGIALVVAHLTAPVLPLLIAGLCFGTLGLVKTVLGLKSTNPVMTSLKPLLTVNLVLQSFDLAGSAYELSQTLSS